MNTFNKSSSYLVQVLTVTPSVLPSSTVYSVYGVYKPENGGNDRFSAAKYGRGQNRGALRAPFCLLSPTKHKILDPPLLTIYLLNWTPLDVKMVKQYALLDVNYLSSQVNVLSA